MSLLTQMLRLNKNPSSIINVALANLSNILAGLDITDATSPFMQLMEVNATTSAAAIIKGEAVARKVYPCLALTELDLYQHMSDLDYSDRFATPASGQVNILIPYTELQTYAVQLNVYNTIRTIKFPKYTNITVNGVSLMIMYPIIIELLDAGIIHISYDVSNIDPLVPLSSNIIPHSLVVLNGIQYLSLAVGVKQLTMTTLTYPLDGTVNFNQTITFNDSFYYAKVYLDDGTKWTEILTTHAPMIYDITKPTAVLSVSNNTNTVGVRLPDIYNSLNNSGLTIRVDVFSTLGDITLNLLDIPISSYSASWNEIDNYADTRPLAPLNKLNDMLFYSTGIVSGGTVAMTVDQLRQKVIYHSDASLAPIRPSDVNMNLIRLGYVVDLVRNTLTDRLYLASKNLPNLMRDGLGVPILSSNSLVNFPLNDKDYVTTIIDNNSGRVTVTNSCLYLVSNNSVSVLSDSNISLLKGKSTAALIAELNTNQYMFSPFHYVVDSSTPTVLVRPYYLDSPFTYGLSYIDSNLNRNYSISVSTTTIVKLNGVYTLTITILKPASLTGVQCQLRYTDLVTGNPVFLYSTPTEFSQEIDFSFIINTSLDIDSSDNIEFTNFLNPINSLTSIFIPLDALFDIYFFLPGDNTGITTRFDSSYNSMNYPTGTIGILYEQININFGTYLSNLYSPIRNILVNKQYLTYSNDVIATYQTDVYEQGQTGLSFVDNNGVLQFNIIHKAGDQVLDNFNVPVVLHKKGDIINDVNGNPLPDPRFPNTIYKQLGVTLYDAKFLFSTTPDIVAYTNNIPHLVIGYLQNEIGIESKNLHEKTLLNYKPLGTVDQILVDIGDNNTVLMSPLLEFNISFYLTENGLKDTKLTSRLKTLIRGMVADHINNTTLAVSDLYAALGTIVMPEIISYTVENYNGTYSMLNIVNTGHQFGIQSSLVLNPDGTIDVFSHVMINLYKI